MLAGVSGTGRVSRAGRDACARDPSNDSDTTTAGRCALCASACRDRGLSLAQGQDEIGLAVVDEIGDLGGAVVRIDRHAADAEAVERQRVQDMLGPVLQQRRDAMADAIARLPVERRQFLDPLPGLAVR